MDISTEGGEQCSMKKKDSYIQLQKIWNEGNVRVVAGQYFADFFIQTNIKDKWELVNAEANMM